MTSLLWRNLGWDRVRGPLFWVGLDAHEVLTDDHLTSVTIRRGSDDPSSHAPSTASLTSITRVDFSTDSLSIDLSDAGAAWLASRTYTAPGPIQRRFYGRRGATTAHDHGRGGWRTTDLTAASWDSVLTRSPSVWTPAAGQSYHTAISALCAPSWAPAVKVVLSAPGGADTWHQAGQPITADDLLSKLSDRLHLFAPLRSGRLTIRTLPSWLARAAEVSVWWPLSRSHVLSPITWSQPADMRKEYRLALRTPTGTTEIITSPTGTPTGTVQLDDKDWTDMVARSEHWRRIYGLRAMTHMNRWSIPRVRVRLDKLIGDPRENHRRAAGRLLLFEVGDAINLAGDWPSLLRGQAYIASINEQITHAGWVMELGLIPWRWINGENTSTPLPRTWDQAVGTWDTTTTKWSDH